jgi:CheY-like chemotaxis protein
VARPKRLKRGHMIQNSGTSRTRNASVAKLKVLVVDDEQVIANTLATILNNSGFEALAVYSGQAALDALTSFEPDVLVSDVIMPEMTGIEAAIDILAQFPGCRVVLFSGNHSTADLLHDAQAQGHYFEILAKPFHPTDLLGRLRAGASPLNGASESASKGIFTTP